MALSNENITEALSCASDIEGEVFISTVGVALIVLIVFQFTQRRRRCCQTCCFGRPSVIVPIDLVQSQPHRLIYVFIFGAISGDIITIFFNVGTIKSISDTIWGSTLAVIATVVLQSLSYFPMFASVNAPIPIIGYLTGFLFSLWLVSRKVYAYVLISQGCFGFITSAQDDPNKWILSLSSFPIVLFQSAAILWFLMKLLKETYRLRKICCGNGEQSLWEAITQRDKSSYHSRRVKSLLMKPQVKKRSFIWRILFRIYPYDPNIQFPLRYLAAIIIMLNIQYMLALFVCAAAFLVSLPLVERVEELQEDADRLANSIENRTRELENLLNFDLSNNTGSIVRTIYSILRDGAYGIAVVFPVGPLLAVIWNTVLLAHMVRSVQKHLKRIAKGDISFFPKKLPPPVTRLVASMRYAGYQIAYFIWAWMLVTLVVWLAGVVGIIIYWLLKYLPGETLSTFVALIVPLLISTAILYSQVLVAKLFFIQDSNNKHTELTNRRIFHWFTYILFFYNVLLGLTSALLRIFYSIAFGLLLMFRLDRVVLMRGFENFDGGHKTYIGFLYLEHTQNNSVLNVFVALLLDLRTDKQTPVHVDRTTGDLEDLCSDVEKGPSVISPDEISRPRVSRGAANRWLVAYTLLRNRTLQELTAARLEEKREVKRKEERGERDLEDRDLEDSVEKEDSIKAADQPAHETSMQSGMEPRDSFQEMAEMVDGSAKVTATTGHSSYHGNIKQTTI